MFQSVTQMASMYVKRVFHRNDYALRSRNTVVLQQNAEFEQILNSSVTVRYDRVTLENPKFLSEKAFSLQKCRLNYRNLFL